ncbi:MAG: hypothetical protein WKG07_38305 [Hymenobacter sp.]
MGEPTGMNAAVAEKGLLVLDGLARGRTGYAARDEGENALYKALDDIAWLRVASFRSVGFTRTGENDGDATQRWHAAQRGAR